MAVGSGLGASIGVKAETVFGTPVVVDRFYEFLSEGLEKQNNIAQSNGLRAATTPNLRRGTRRAITSKAGSGGTSFEVARTGFGLLFNHMLGGTSTVVQQGVTTAWLQTHSLGDLGGKSLTVQKGVPQTDGTVKPFTFHGCKVSDWEFSIAPDEILQLGVTFDAEDVDTATTLATPSYSATKVFHFAQGALTVGGTAVAAVTNASVAGNNNLKTDRFYLGSAGLKKEPLQSGYPEVTGSLDAEFVSQATFYDLHAADTAAALTLTFTGDVISGAYSEYVKITVPEVHFTGDTPKVGGPEVVVQNVEWEAAFDGTNAGVKIEYMSTDVAV